MLSIILSLLLTASGLRVTVTAPQGCHPCYVQIDPTAGITTEPQFYQFNLEAGDTFGHTVLVTRAPDQAGAVRVRVWTETSGQDADADQIITITAGPHRVYLPL